jgi:GntR family transcriptional regulator
MNFSIDHKNPIPLHIQTEELLRKIVRSPQYAKGKLLPNEVVLAKQLAISRTTLRLAINKLVYEGLLIRKKGVGTRVGNSVVSSKSANWLSFSQEMESRKIPIKNFELQLSWVKAEER